uniref:Uncharacterized protein n=1 Tax=Knipowitschia caucasica TaxID=637954 RepID=A0AAV2JJX2_KNICA
MNRRLLTSPKDATGCQEYPASDKSTMSHLTLRNIWAPCKAADTNIWARLRLAANIAIVANVSSEAVGWGMLRAVFGAAERTVPPNVQLLMRRKPCYAPHHHPCVCAKLLSARRWWLRCSGGGGTSD